MRVAREPFELCPRTSREAPITQIAARMKCFRLSLLRNLSVTTETQRSQSLNMARQRSGPACYGTQTYPWPRHTGIFADPSRLEAGHLERRPPTSPWDSRLAKYVSTRGSELPPSCRAQP